MRSAGILRTLLTQICPHFPKDLKDFADARRTVPVGTDPPIHRVRAISPKSSSAPAPRTAIAFRDEEPARSGGVGPLVVQPLPKVSCRVQELVRELRGASSPRCHDYLLEEDCRYLRIGHTYLWAGCDDCALVHYIRYHGGHCGEITGVTKQQSTRTLPRPYFLPGM